MKLDLKELIAKLTDTPMVIEEGTSGIWNYRKWSNGMAECWGTHGETITGYASGVAGLYSFTSSQIAFPTGLFIARPNVVYGCTAGGGFAISGTNVSINTTNMYGYTLATQSGSQACLFDIKATGRWK